MAYPEDIPDEAFEDEETHIPDTNRHFTATRNIDNRLNDVEIALPLKSDAHSHPYAPTTHSHLASAVTDFNAAVRTNRLDQMALPTASLSMNSQKISLLAPPTISTDAVNKAYVDSLLLGPTLAPDVINVQNHGVINDAKKIRVSVTAGSKNVTCQYSPYAEGASVFSPADVGKILHIDKASSSGNFGWHRTTIESYISPTQVTVVQAPTRTTNGIAYDGQTTFSNCVFGTDNTAAINTVFSLAVSDPFTRGVYFPGGTYMYYTNGNHILNAKQNGLTIYGDNFRLDDTTIVTTNQTNSVFVYTNCYLIFTKNLFFLHAAKNTEDVTYSGGTDSTGPNGGYGTGDLNDAPSAPTAGAAITVNGALNYYHVFYETHSAGFYRHLDLNNLSQARVYKNQAFNPVYEGVRYANYALPDWGGFFVNKSFLTNARRQYVGLAQKGINWVAGGGVLIDANEISGFTSGVVCQQIGSVGYGSSQIRILGNSFEDWGTGGYGVLIKNSQPAETTGDLFNVAIANNNLASVLHGGVNAIHVESIGGTGRIGGGKSLSAITTTGNTGFIQGTAVNYINVYGGAVGLNYLRSATAQFVQSNCLGILT